MKKLVIVESPTKAKTIRKFLQSSRTKDEFVIDSSMGHIRDLPNKASEVPAKYKAESWSRLGINVETDFSPIYIVPPDKKKVVKRLKEELKTADELILATDEDREGEAISWHLKEVLKPKVPVKRMVFHEITKEAIIHALENPRDVDDDLVHAQETRRVLDRLVGYGVSPVLWRRIGPSLSAGRVQSVAVQLIVERERERMKFRKGSYFDLEAILNASGNDFKSKLFSLNDKRIATGKDFDESTGKLAKPDSVRLLDETLAEDLKKDIESKASWTINKIQTKSEKRRPFAPFTTSTLQQEANRKLNLSARDTMRTAQSLYENGYITYMRTDSTNLSSQAIDAARLAVGRMYGQDYLSPSVKTYGKAKGAQEAHEAIRPAGSVFPQPNETGLSGIELRLYDLIWKRTVASQMADAELLFTNVDIEAKTDKNAAIFKSSGKEIVFPGFFRAYVEGSDDPDAALENQENPLPKLTEGQQSTCKDLKAIGHETKPPARFTEATLVKSLEKEGIGRPSTYATIISTIQDRRYVTKNGSQLVPTFTAFAVTQFLEGHFPDLVDRQFTSEMEAKLDEIAHGDQPSLAYLQNFYNGEKGLQQAITSNETQTEGEDARLLELPLEELPENVSVHIGRYGPYLVKHEAGEEVRASIPQGILPADLNAKKVEEIIKQAEEGPQSLGLDPDTGLNVYSLSGRFGPYVQLGLQDEESNPKPKRASLPKGMASEEVTLESALSLLELPRVVGTHPEDGKEVKAGIGRFGPYVVHSGVYASLKKEDDVLTVDLARALELFEAKAKRASGTKQVLLDLGAHPKDGKPVQVLDGRYGPYVNHLKVNASLPKGSDPKKLSMQEALDLLETAKNKPKTKSRRRSS